jgi:squalene synthase HpnD
MTGSSMPPDTIRRSTPPGAARRSTPLGAAQADLDAVEAIVRSAGTSFYHGMRVLPPDRRHAMYAIYAFCRIVDDIADEAGTLEEKRLGLAGWRDNIAALYQGRTEGPVTRVLAAAVPRFQLRAEDFIAVIDGMQTDAEIVVVAPDMAALDLYCDRVASAVGRLSVRTFGDASPAADKVAHALGRALQLTNILRDIKEDAGRGRIYLPLEYLQDAGVPADPVALLTAPGLPAVCDRLAALAHRYFREARESMAACNGIAMKPARLMAATYDSILSALERRGWNRLDERVSLPKWKKLWLACRYGLF